MGDGMAIVPTGDTVYAPCNAKVSVLMEESKHAVGLVLENGVEMLIHVGLDTVNMAGEGFEYLVKTDQRVKAGDALLKFDREKIKAAGHPDTVVVVMTDKPADCNLVLITEGNVTANETNLSK